MNCMERGGGGDGGDRSVVFLFLKKLDGAHENLF